MKDSIKREKSQACLSYSERENKTENQSHPYPRYAAHDGADGVGDNDHRDENCDVEDGWWRFG